MPGFDFDTIDVDAYERYRPSYASEAVEWFEQRAGMHPHARVLDLAAGTGKLTRALSAAGMDVLAVEPSAMMRRKLAEAVPVEQVVRGTAEAIPLPDESVDAVTVAQAFHQFRLLEAIEEIHRVLRMGGHLALFWNVYRPGDPTKVAIDAIIDRYIPPEIAVQAASGIWQEALRSSDRFESIEVRAFPHPHTLPAARLGALMATSSDVAALPLDQRRRLLEETEELARPLAAAELTIDADTRVDLFRRI
jgi:SAM-dependent methyltransferase